MIKNTLQQIYIVKDREFLVIGWTKFFFIQVPRHTIQTPKVVQGSGCHMNVLTGIAYHPVRSIRVKQNNSSGKKSRTYKRLAW